MECLTSISSIPGQLQVQDLEFQIAGVEIQLVHPDGSPAPRQALHVQAPRFGTIPIVTDEQGYYRLDAVPVEGLRVQTIDRREIGTIKPEPGQRWTELELTLPE